MEKLDGQFSTRITSSLQDRINKILEEEGIDKRDYLEKAYALYEAQRLKEGSPEFSNDILEVEGLTTRIYQIFNSMVIQSSNLKNIAVRELEQKLETKEGQLQEYISKVKEAENRAELSKNEMIQIAEINDDLVKQLNELRQSNMDKQSLVEQFKEKNDFLTGQLTEYKSFSDENKKLEEQLSRQQSAVNELKGQVQDQDHLINELNREIESLNKQHENELSMLTDKKDFELKSAVLDAEKVFQEKLLQANESYTNKLQSSFDEVNRIRSSFEAKIEEMKNQYENSILELKKDNENLQNLFTRLQQKYEQEIKKK